MGVGGAGDEALDSSSSLPMNGFRSSSSPSCSGEAARDGVFGGVGVLVTRLGFIVGGLGGCFKALGKIRLDEREGDPAETGAGG